MGAQHTPGPWSVHPQRAVVVPLGHVVRPIGAASDPETDLRTYAQEICLMHYPDPHRPEAEVEANACLIAAAPDLLAAALAWEAAEDARNDCTDDEDGCDNEGPWEACPLCSLRFGEAIDMRHAAIAKARGEA